MTSTIKGKATTFTATKHSSASDGTFLGMYYPESGAVTIVFSIRFASDSPTATALWTIPTEYRPKTAVAYPVIVYNSALAPIAYSGRINTDGTVTQLATGTCRQAYGVATYKI